MTWSIWIVLGLVLAAIELATPGGIFIIFFAVGALAVGTLAFSGLVTTSWVQWLLFTAIALIALRLFRQPILARLNRNERTGEVDSMVGEVATPSAPIPPGGHGKAELRGSTWNVRNVSDVTLSSGQRSRVVHVEGLTLDIRPE